MAHPQSFDRVRTVISEIRSCLRRADELYWSEGTPPEAERVDADLRDQSTFDFRFGALRPRTQALDPFELQMQGLGATYHPPRLIELQHYEADGSEFVAAVVSAVAKPVGSSPLPPAAPANRWWFAERDGAWRVIAWQALDGDHDPLVWGPPMSGDQTVDVASLGEPTATLREPDAS